MKNKQEKGTNDSIYSQPSQANICESNDPIVNNVELENKNDLNDHYSKLGNKAIVPTYHSLANGDKEKGDIWCALTNIVNRETREEYYDVVSECMKEDGPDRISVKYILAGILEELAKMRILMTEQVAQHFDKGFDYEHTE